MKRILFCLLPFVLFSCNLDGNGDSNSSDVSLAHINEALSTSTGLRIVQFIDDGEDETSDFSDFLFRFRSDGSLTATRGDEVVQGTYRVFRDDGRNELEMDFPSNSILDDLDDDWYFVSKADGRLTFEDDSSDGDLERLVFAF